ncbi:MAG: hypothetical protein SynsKO_08480 [Synoicihabitans sp.]
MKKFARLLLCLSLAALFAGISPLAAQDGNPLKSEMKAYRVVTDAEGEETLVATDNVEPGETVEYVMTYSNVSDQTLNQIRVQGPVPPEMVYVADSASKPAGVLVEYSVDGGQTFSVPPVKYQKQLEDGTIVEAVATPDLYNLVRWTISSLSGSDSATLRYRVSVR